MPTYSVLSNRNQWNCLCKFGVLHISDSFIYHCFTYTAHERGFLKSKRLGTILLDNSHLAPLPITYSSFKTQLKVSVDCTSSRLAFHQLKSKLCTLTADSQFNFHLKKMLRLFFWLLCLLKICPKKIAHIPHKYNVMDACTSYSRQKNSLSMRCVLF